MLTFTPISHQLTLFDYNEMRPKCRVPLKRISRKRYNEAVKQFKKGEDRPLLEVLRSINDDLENYSRRLSNKKLKP